MDVESGTMNFTQQCIEYLDGVLDEIRGFGDSVCVLEDTHLATLNIQRAEALDIEEQTVDFGRRFFYPRFTLDQARQKTTDFFTDHEEELNHHVWPKRCRRGSFDDDVCEPSRGPLDPEERHPLCYAETDAQFRLDWFIAASGMYYDDPWSTSPNLGVWEGSEWRYRIAGNLPGHSPPGVRVGTPPQAYSFRVSTACLIEDDAAQIPHIGGTVLDSVESKEGEVLRSEVVAAVAFLKLQFRRGDFCHHHTLPAIVFSFQHDRFGRVTQFHFDGRSLVLRQSRLLNFRSDEPTIDAYHMIRWMANRPMGETRFRKAAEEGPEGPGLRDVDQSSGQLPVEVRGA
ncbi:hypothetical protein BT67DRAFT_449993 [Trichocladium antarcticum]|uniref:Uncharacterized protein n=1 Tax=Trichocladium antarcticum TaxID=1450529 RepID=A0AAN6UJM3_9PEZI|nr:hypothetical protein BT67DRAFT_449993 [Trichocladium antarcticum]